MALPKQRHTRHRRDRARKMLELKSRKTGVCPKCASPVLPHHACKTCGTYRGRDVVTLKAPKLKQEKTA